MADELLLKWGSLKGWGLESPAAIAAMERFVALGMSMSAACQEMTPAHKEALCDLIDAVDGEIQNDWTGKIMTKDEAKKYVLEYRS